MNERLTPALDGRQWNATANDEAIREAIHTMATKLSEVIGTPRSYRPIAALGNQFSAWSGDRAAFTRQDAEDLWRVGAGEITGHAATAVCERVGAKIAAFVAPPAVKAPDTVSH